MPYSEKMIRLRDGRDCVLRPADPERDAVAFLTFLRTSRAETPYCPLGPEEFTTDVDQGRAALRRICGSPNQLLLLAEADGCLVGDGHLSRLESLRRRHRCEVAVAISRAFWSLGIGTALLSDLLNAAEEWGCEQAELEVVSTNDRAVSLYRKLGFRFCGVRPRAFKYADGAYADLRMMVKWLTPSNSPLTSQT